MQMWLQGIEYNIIRVPKTYQNALVYQPFVHEILIAVISPSRLFSYLLFTCTQQIQDNTSCKSVLNI